MSKLEQDYVERFIEVVDEATHRHKKINELRNQQVMTMGIALQIFDEYSGVLSYLNHEKQEYFMQWKEWIEKRNAQMYPQHPSTYVN